MATVENAKQIAKDIFVDFGAELGEYLSQSQAANVNVQEATITAQSQLGAVRTQSEQSWHAIMEQREQMNQFRPNLSNAANDAQEIAMKSRSN